MKLPLPFYIGLRYINSKSRNRYISFVSGFSLLGMLLGSLALIVVLSVMNGFDREIKQRLLQVIPHGTVSADTYIDNWRSLKQIADKTPDVVFSAPYISGHGMVNYEGGLHGVSLRGLIPEHIPQLTQLQDRMLVGNIADLNQQPFGIIIGRLLARNLGVTLGDKISITLPLLTATPLGMFPRSKKFTVIGVFEIGAQLDQELVILNLSDAKKLFRTGTRVTGIEVLTSNMFTAPKTMAKLKNVFTQKSEKNLLFEDWSETQGSLFSAVKMEKNVVTALLTILIAIAAFNIVSSLILMVSDKRSDIAVLRTLGLSRVQIMCVFIVQGGCLGMLGVIIGSALGCLLALNLASVVSVLESVLGIVIFNPNVYFINQMPSELLWQDLGFVVGAGCLLSLLATLYPAFRASKIEPAEALRYE
jgi:lipoprotein-releasing system permease protein